MKIKLQPPTSNELPGYNPILPPSAITQVMLLSNPVKVTALNIVGRFLSTKAPPEIYCFSFKDRIRLKFRISYEVNGVKSVETGDLENFPIL
jgi:ADP-ribosylation factor-binding protein GGA